MYKNIKMLNKKDKVTFGYILVILLVLLIIFCNATIIYNYLLQLYTILILLLVALNLNKRTYINNSVSIPWILLYIYIIITIPNSDYIYQTVIALYFNLICVFFIISNKKNDSFYKTATNLIFMTTCALNFITLISLKVDNFIPTKFYFLFTPERLSVIDNELKRFSYSGIAGEVSFNAFAMCIGIGFVFSRMISNHKIRILDMILFFLFYVSIMVTQKRALLIAPICVCLIIFLIVKDKLKYRKFFLLSLMIILGVLIIINFMPKATIVFDRFDMTSSNSINLSGRDKLWRYALEMFKQNPLLGMGLGSYNEYCNFNKYFVGQRNAHNIYYQLLAEIGILGLTLFIYAVCKTIKVTINLIRKNDIINNKSDLFILVYSLFVQLIFILYGLSGNTFFNYFQLLAYFFFVSISVYINNKYSRKI